MMDNFKPRMVVGTSYKKVENAACGNPWGGWKADENTELEDAAFGFIIMRNGATVTLDATWALNTCEPIPEGSCELCGSKAGVRIRGNEVIVNKCAFDKQVDSVPDLETGGVAFYDSISMTPEIVEQIRWFDALDSDTDPWVLPEQACVVSEILEAIYTSAESGKPVYFD